RHEYRRGSSGPSRKDPDKHDRCRPRSVTKVRNTSGVDVARRSTMTAASPSSAAQPAATLSADVGGTWVRLRTSEDPGPVVRLPSPSLLNLPNRSVDELRRDMVELLCSAAPATACAAISFGAAIDHLTGTVYGSAPLWGASAEPYDLAAALRRRRP